MKAKHEFEAQFTEGEWANSAYRDYLRTYAAISAMNGLLSDSANLIHAAEESAKLADKPNVYLAKLAVAIADDLLSELSKPLKS